MPWLSSVPCRTAVIWLLISPKGACSADSRLRQGILIRVVDTELIGSPPFSAGYLSSHKVLHDRRERGSGGVVSRRAVKRVDVGTDQERGVISVA